MPLDINNFIVNSTLVEQTGIGGVITSGLVCYIDAALKHSYPGGGTTIYDLSGNNNHGTLTNGPTFNTANGGVIALDGVDDYIVLTSPNMSATNYTVIGAARYVNSASGRTFSGANNNWLMGHWSTTTLNHYAEGWITGVGAGPSDFDWRIYASTGNISGDTYTFYANNTQIASSSGGSAGPNGFNIGRYPFNTTEYSNSHISFMLVYNRILSTTELTYTYNIFKDRFNL